jgi:hypothetical protein
MGQSHLLYEGSRTVRGVGRRAPSQHTFGGSSLGGRGRHALSCRHARGEAGGQLRDVLWGSTAPAGDFAKAASARVKILAGHSPERVTAICPACTAEIRLPHDPARMAVATRFARAPAPLLHPYLWRVVAVAAGSRPPSRHAFTALLRQYHGVDHVNHTVRGRDVCLDDLGVLDRYRPVVRGDG